MISCFGKVENSKICGVINANRAKFLGSYEKKGMDFASLIMITVGRCRSQLLKQQIVIVSESSCGYYRS